MHRLLLNLQVDLGNTHQVAEAEVKKNLKIGKTKDVLI